MPARCDALFVEQTNEALAQGSEPFGGREVFRTVSGGIAVYDLTQVIAQFFQHGQNMGVIERATSLTLTHVNVLWITSDSPSETERDHIGIAGMQLTRYFLERNWPPGNVRTGVMRDSGEVVPFVGMDSTGAGVEVLVKGIPVTDGGGQTTTPEGEAMLRVGYSSRYGSPDVIRVEPGEF